MRVGTSIWSVVNYSHSTYEFENGIYGFKCLYVLDCFGLAIKWVYCDWIWDWIIVLCYLNIIKDFIFTGLGKY